MDWKNWQGNIESILHYFLAMAQPIKFNGPMTRNSLLEYCEKTYTGFPQGVSSSNQLNWAYSTTWKNTYLPAMLKLAMFQERNGKLELTPAALQLLEHKVSPTIFFQRQLIEYQYINPKQEGELNVLKNHIDCNLFPYWVLLKFLRELKKITKEEAIYILLKLDNYSEQILEKTINKVNELRQLQADNSEDEFKRLLEQRFGPRNSFNKAWQYERNFLKWTGFALDGENQSLILNRSRSEELDLWLDRYPTYIEYKTYDSWVQYHGRSFDVEEGETHVMNNSKIHLFKEVNGDLYNVENDSMEIVTDREEARIVATGDMILIATMENGYRINDIWITTETVIDGTTSSIKAKRDRVLSKGVSYKELIRRNIVKE